MRNETVFLILGLIGVYYLINKSGHVSQTGSTPQGGTSSTTGSGTGGGITWIGCSDPNADQVMCALL
jgi:hypothetical protein